VITPNALSLSLSDISLALFSVLFSLVAHWVLTEYSHRNNVRTNIATLGASNVTAFDIFNASGYVYTELRDDASQRASESTHAIFRPSFFAVVTSADNIALLICVTFLFIATAASVVVFVLVVVISAVTVLASTPRDCACAAAVVFIATVLLVVGTVSCGSRGVWSVRASDIVVVGGVIRGRGRGNAHFRFRVFHRVGHE